MRKHKTKGPGASQASDPSRFDPLPGRTKRKNTPLRISTQAATAVYRDGVLIGFVVERLHGADAITTSRHLGRYNTTESAMRALFALTPRSSVCEP